jgi:ligand-binding sensor domain-containing protein/serine phosphatase RsbU (regulator of sigma subunit)
MMHYSGIKSKLGIILLVFMLACNSDSPDEDTTNVPTYAQPQIVPLNLTAGYSINQTWGDTLIPLVSELGDTVSYQEAQSFEGSVYSLDSILTSEITLLAAPELLYEAKNIKLALEPISKPIIQVNLAQKYKVFEFLNANGDSVITGVPIPVEPNLIRATIPEAIPAKPGYFKEDFITNMRQYRTDEGLSSNYCNVVKEDLEGNLWIGNWHGGLSKYDGSSFIHITDIEGFELNNITDILCDSKGNIWLATFEGLYKYDGHQFYRLSVDDGLPMDHLLVLYEDSKQNIWIGSKKGGATKYDGKTFTNYGIDEGFSHLMISDILEDHEGTMWFTTSSGITRMDDNGIERLAFDEEILGNHFTSVAEDSSGDLWFGTFKLGLFKYNETECVNFNSENGLTNDVIYDIEIEENGKMWIASRGLIAYDGKHFQHFGQNEGILEKVIYDLELTRNGNLWMVQTGGIIQMKPNTFNYRGYQNGLGNGEIRGLAHDADGNLLVGSQQGLLIVSDSITYKIGKEQGLPSENCSSVFQSSKGNTWISTWDGVSMYDGKSLLNFHTNHLIDLSFVITVYPDSKGRVWFGSIYHGLCMYDGENVTHFGINQGLGSSSVPAIVEDHNGVLWFGTDGAGLLKLENGEITRFTCKEGLPTENIYNLKVDLAGDLWILGSQELVKFDGKNFTIFTEDNIPGINDVVGFVNPKKNEFWITSGSEGLTFLKHYPDSLYSLVNFDKRDGLRTKLFSAPSVVDSKGEVTWATEAGLLKSSADISGLVRGQKVRKPRLRDLQINENYISYFDRLDSLGELQYDSVTPFENSPLNLVLPYNHNHLTFHYSSIDIDAPEFVQYQYRIIGLDSKWSKPTGNNIADYRNLPFGVFDFQVRAAGKNGSWTEPFSFSFEITAPWWSTWWARTLYVALLIIIIYLIFKWRTGQLRKRQKELETKVINATTKIQLQKDKIEEAHKEITDSIVYAKRIQSAILAPPRLVKEYLKDAFILYLPKDVVAGDFYWLEKVSDTKVLFAAADCTGHGVPGAMVSVVCNNSLNRSVREYGLTELGEILDKTRELVIEEFDKSDEEVKDGMDIALCSVEGMKLEYTGANNPLWIIRDGEILETKANKQPIGKYTDPEPFTTHSIDLSKGDTIYIFSDGFVDQFGGEKGKKLKPSNFRKLLLSIQEESMEKQKTLLDEAFESWRGDLEQIDDVCVIGVRI